MDLNGGRSLTASESPLAGRVAGAVLKALREHSDLTQARFAEMLGVGVTTVQGWETGRRPLINARFGDLQGIRRLLQVRKVSAELLGVWDQALTADTILGAVSTPTPEAHPLALVVPDRTLTELLAWPISGVPPQQLDAVRARLPMDAEARDHMAAELRTAADLSAADERGAMLRRQARFLVVTHGPSQEWLAQTASRDVPARRDLQDWTPNWPVARSHAVSAAVGGDPEALQRFIRDGLTTEQGIAANLSYWAYWVGEIRTPWSMDAEMLDAQDWSGERLLSSLLHGLRNAPYRELCGHALWALLKHRPHLIDRAAARARISTVIDAVTSEDSAVTGETRRRLEQVAYHLGSRA